MCYGTLMKVLSISSISFIVMFGLPDMYVLKVLLKDNLFVGKNEQYILIINEDN